MNTIILAFPHCIDIICLCVCFTHSRERVSVLLMFVSLAPSLIPSAQLLFVRLNDYILLALSPLQKEKSIQLYLGTRNSRKNEKKTEFSSPCSNFLFH